MQVNTSILDQLYLYTGDELGNPGVNSITGCPMISTMDVLENCFSTESADLDGLTNICWTVMSEIDFNNWSQYAIDQIIEECRDGSLAIEHTDIKPEQIAQVIEYLARED